MPKNINLFLDLFGGGFNVGINANAKNVIYNDSCSQVTDLLNNLKRHDSEFIHNKILETTNEYGLNRLNKVSEELYKIRYKKLREDYNRQPEWIKFYTLITCSFSNQIRFNNSGEFNMPYGSRYYNHSLQEKLKMFVERLNQGNYTFMSYDFGMLDYKSLSKDDYVYVDPPYYSSIATYNENGGWTEQDERELLNLLDILHSRGIKFGLSNNLKYDNPLLDKWIDKYDIHYLNMDYGNCNYQKKDKSKDIEVFITNY